MNKVLAIAPYPYLPYFSGGQKYIAQFLEHLGRHTELTVVTVAENDFSLAKTYSTVPLLKKSFLRYIDRGLVTKLTELIHSKKIDTLICEHPYFAWLAFSLKKKTGVRVIIHAHNIEYQRFRSTGKWWWPVLKRYEKRSLKNADAVLFISPEDRLFAVKEWQLDSAKCFEIPYGVEQHTPVPDELVARQTIRWNYGFTENEKIILFAGLLNYKPNAEALRVILEKINPVLEATPGFTYRILVCGKNLPDSFSNLDDYAKKNVQYAGFVDSIDNFYRGADIFLNPVMTGGGVKTKVLEAIAGGATVVSTEAGAAGVDREVCGNKLVVVKNNDWEAFANAVIESSKLYEETPASFYSRYSWKEIMKNMAHALAKQTAG